MTKITPISIKTNENIEITSNELSRAFQQEQFLLHYQPIASVINGEIHEIEALLRWQHPIHGLLNADAFLPLCERNGLIIPLGEWVIRSACKQIKNWHDMGYSKLSLSLNLSPDQLNQPEFLNLISDVLKNSISPSYLKLEITESILLQNTTVNIQLLKKLKDLGLNLSLDDFGTGYASLTYLKEFPFDILKIDKSFVSDMTTNITSAAIVNSIIHLGKNLGLTLIAEGVENEDQLHMLRTMKCDLFQGYLCSKALPVNELNQYFLSSGKISTCFGN